MDFAQFQELFHGLKNETNQENRQILESNYFQCINQEGPQVVLFLLQIASQHLNQSNFQFSLLLLRQITRNYSTIFGVDPAPFDNIIFNTLFSFQANPNINIPEIRSVLEVLIPSFGKIFGQNRWPTFFESLTQLCLSPDPLIASSSIECFSECIQQFVLSDLSGPMKIILENSSGRISDTSIALSIFHAVFSYIEKFGSNGVFNQISQIIIPFFTEHISNHLVLKKFLKYIGDFMPIELNFFIESGIFEPMIFALLQLSTHHEFDSSFRIQSISIIQEIGQNHASQLLPYISQIFEALSLILCEFTYEQDIDDEEQFENTPIASAEDAISSLSESFNRIAQKSEICFYELFPVLINSLLSGSIQQQRAAFQILYLCSSEAYYGYSKYTDALFSIFHTFLLPDHIHPILTPAVLRAFSNIIQQEDFASNYGSILIRSVIQAPFCPALVLAISQVCEEAQQFPDLIPSDVSILVPLMNLISLDAISKNPITLTENALKGLAYLLRANIIDPESQNDVIKQLLALVGIEVSSIASLSCWALGLSSQSLENEQFVKISSYLLTRIVVLLEQQYETLDQKSLDSITSALQILFIQFEKRDISFDPIDEQINHITLKLMQIASEDLHITIISSNEDDSDRDNGNEIIRDSNGDKISFSKGQSELIEHALNVLNMLITANSMILTKTGFAQSFFTVLTKCASYWYNSAVLCNVSECLNTLILYSFQGGADLTQLLMILDILFEKVDKNPDIYIIRDFEISVGILISCATKQPALGPILSTHLIQYTFSIISALKKTYSTINEESMEDEIDTINLISDIHQEAGIMLGSALTFTPGPIPEQLQAAFPVDFGGSRLKYECFIKGSMNLFIRAGKIDLAISLIKDSAQDNEPSIRRSAFDSLSYLFETDHPFIQSNLQEVLNITLNSLTEEGNQEGEMKTASDSALYVLTLILQKDPDLMQQKKIFDIWIKAMPPDQENFPSQFSTQDATICSFFSDILISSPILSNNDYVEIALKIIGQIFDCKSLTDSNRTKICSYVNQLKCNNIQLFNSIVSELDGESQCVFQSMFQD